jgi:class 3 adenylate cyclase
MTVGSSRTNGFLFADLRDYTRYVESHGDAAAARLLETYRSLVRGAVAGFGGAEIKTEGDSFYVVFPSASSAVQCGLAILDAAAERSAADGVPIRVGIGVHAGETVETSEGYVGSAVNVAARVCAQARAGELLVTDTVRALTRTFLPVRFGDRRIRRLKGIAEPVVMFRVEPAVPGDGTVRPAARRVRLPEALTGSRAFGRSVLVLVGLMVGGAAAGYLLVAAQRPPVVPSGSPTPTAAVSTSFPTAAEAALVVSVPLPIRDACRRTAADDEQLGSVASVRCDLDVAADADTVWYDRFATDQQVATAFDEIRLRERTPFVDCSPTVSRGRGNWHVATHAGTLQCFQDDGETWIVWTYRADRILARAVRAGTAPEDWTELYAWWEEIRLFQR